MKRIGVLTSGGDCPGLNAVIRGAVKSSQQLGYECIGFLRGYEGLVDPVTYKQLNNKNTSGILNQGGTILGSTNKGRFVARSGVDNREELDIELLAGVKVTCEQLDIEGLICIGGDGSLSIAQQLHEHGMSLTDFKSSNGKIKKGSVKELKYKLQLGGYALALDEMYKEKNIIINRASILCVDKQSDILQEIESVGKELAEYKEKFKELVVQYHIKNNTEYLINDRE